MPRGDKLLLIVLRLFGGAALFALVAVVMPFSWMGEVHRWMRLGELPDDAIVEYLARSLSAFYAFFGGLCLLISTDLERYRPIVRYLGLALIALGVIFIGTDMSAGMPLWWSATEGPPEIAIGGLIVWLSRNRT